MVCYAELDEIVVFLVNAKVVHKPYLSCSAEMSVKIVKRLER